MLDPTFCFPICKSATTTLSGSWLLQLRPWAWKAPALADGLVLVLSATGALHGSCRGQGHDGEGPLATKPAGWTG